MGEVLLSSRRFDEQIDIPDREYLTNNKPNQAIYSRSGTFDHFPWILGHNIPDRELSMRYSAQELGKEIRRARKLLKVTQRDLALTSGTGIRFIIELEQGKPTCQLGKALTVMNTLGIEMDLTLPTLR